jgi:2-dehydro-3-deoxyphosphogluconate aldolase/(4S)-4-hydroxy-2-oxoglutarate aldolase
MATRLVQCLMVRDMTKEEVRTRIEEIGIIPGLRVSSADDALFAAEAISTSGINIVEITMTVPGALEVISALERTEPHLIAGAGTVWGGETARRCLDAGAKFLTTTGLDLEVLEVAAKEKVLVFPGALTPTEVRATWEAGCDMVKIFPCALMGGARYIQTLKAPFPDTPFIAAGGVTHQNAGEFIQAGAVALGIGRDLIPPVAIQLRQPHRIQELGRRLVAVVREARNHRNSH